MSVPPPVLSIADLTIAAGTRELVTGLHLQIPDGGRLGLIGESGSGKSLTALAVSGLLPEGLTATGSVLLGRDSTTQVIGARERELVGVRGRVSAMVFQEPLTALDPLMRLGAQVAEPLQRLARRQGTRLSRDQLASGIRSALTEVSLPDPDRIAHAYPHEVSGGQRQRVAIAMALAVQPSLLIADEPTTALDVTVQGEVLELLDRVVADRRMALLFISHDLAVVSRVVRDVIVLRQGVEVERGSIADLLSAPKHEYTRALVAGARAFDDALGRLA